MNIFALDHNPAIAAIYHNDTHVSKQFLESCQILSTTIWHYIYSNHKEYSKLGERGCPNEIKTQYKDETGLYLPTQINHPAMKWVRKSYDNFVWLIDLASNLHFEYKFRKGKTHKSSETLHQIIYNMGFISNMFPQVGFTDFDICFDVSKYPKCNVDKDVIDIYRDYYNHYKRGYYRGDKFYEYKWTNRNIPFFMV